jgi:hypothetical protein
MYFAFENQKSTDLIALHITRERIKLMVDYIVSEHIFPWLSDLYCDLHDINPNYNTNMDEIFFAQNIRIWGLIYLNLGLKLI